MVKKIKEKVDEERKITKTEISTPIEKRVPKFIHFRSKQAKNTECKQCTTAQSALRLPLNITIVGVLPKSYPQSAEDRTKIEDTIFTVLIMLCNKTRNIIDNRECIAFLLYRTCF